MTGIEIALLLIGCVFMIGSFFVSEKLSGTEINRIAELSDNELKRIIGKGMENAESQIDNVVEDKVEEGASALSKSEQRFLIEKSLVNFNSVFTDEYAKEILDSINDLTKNETGLDFNHILKT